MPDMDPTLFNPEVAHTYRLYGVKIWKIRAIEYLTLGHLQYQFVRSKRRIPSVFFLKFIFSKLFIVIFTLKMYSFFTCQFKWSSN